MKRIQIKFLIVNIANYILAHRHSVQKRMIEMSIQHEKRPSLAIKYLTRACFSYAAFVLF